MLMTDAEVKLYAYPFTAIFVDDATTSYCDPQTGVMYLNTHDSRTVVHEKMHLLYTVQDTYRMEAACKKLGVSVKAIYKFHNFVEDARINSHARTTEKPRCLCHNYDDKVIEINGYLRASGQWRTATDVLWNILVASYFIGTPYYDTFDWVSKFSPEFVSELWEYHNESDNQAAFDRYVTRTFKMILDEIARLIKDEGVSPTSNEPSDGSSSDDSSSDGSSSDDSSSDDSSSDGSSSDDNSDPEEDWEVDGDGDADGDADSEADDDGDTDGDADGDDDSEADDDGDTDCDGDGDADGDADGDDDSEADGESDDDGDDADDDGDDAESDDGDDADGDDAEADDEDDAEADDDASDDGSSDDDCDVDVEPTTWESLPDQLKQKLNKYFDDDEDIGADKLVSTGVGVNPHSLLVEGPLNAYVDTLADAAFSHKLKQFFLSTLWKAPTSLTGRCSGDMDKRLLKKYAVYKDPRIFERHTPGVKLNIAPMFATDLSGSFDAYYRDAYKCMASMVSAMRALHMPTSAYAFADNAVKVNDGSSAMTMFTTALRLAGDCTNIIEILVEYNTWIYTHMDQNPTLFILTDGQFDFEERQLLSELARKSKVYLFLFGPGASGVSNCTNIYISSLEGYQEELIAALKQSMKGGV